VASVDSQTSIAHFAYRNDTNQIVRRLIGPDNYFVPGPQNRGQPNLFAPGQSSPYPNAAFTVEFPAGTALAWRLNDATVIASDNSPQCAQNIGRGLFAVNLWRGIR
jgi:hypothetical protein